MEMNTELIDLCSEYLGTQERVKGFLTELIEVFEGWDLTFEEAAEELRKVIE